MAERQGRHMVQLVDDLRDLGAVARGEVQLEPRRVDLRAVAQEAVQNCHTALLQKGHTLAVQTLPDPLWVEGDHTRLVQVAANLLSNAVKFTPPGGNITVRTDREDLQVRLVVADNGIGVEPGMQEEIFGLFVQGEHPWPTTGMGLGLHLVRRLVRLHGGTVTVESHGTGQGSVFVVRLPAAGLEP
jgi:signal transduction histidine kinase